MNGTITRKALEGYRGLALSLTAYPGNGENVLPSTYWTSRDRQGIRVKELQSVLHAAEEDVSGFYKDGLPSDLRSTIADVIGLTSDELRGMGSEERADVIMAIEGTVPYHTLTGRYIAERILSNEAKRRGVLRYINPQLVDLYALEILEQLTAQDKIGDDGCCRSVHMNVQTGKKPQLTMVNAKQFLTGNERPAKPFVHSIGTNKAKSMDTSLRSFAKHIVKQICSNFCEYGKYVPEGSISQFRTEITNAAAFLGVELI
jgi:hypothetical protein